MIRLINVARYHLLNRVEYLVLPIGVPLFAFAVNLVVFALVDAPEDEFSGGLTSLYAVVFVSGVLSVARSLPFGLTLGLSRRSYFLGTLTLIGGLAAVLSAGVVLMQALERATGGWGLRVHFFRVPWILDGPWYATWLTSFVVLVLMFLYGMWFGLVHRRWSALGTAVFGAAQVLVLLAGVVLITWTRSWAAVGDVAGSLSVPGVVGLLAALAAALGVGGFATMRQVTV